jgi:glycosyltransferase involved in cell wall biosynthesis
VTEGLHVVHTIAGLGAAAGGVARSVPGLCEALARNGVPVCLLTQRPWGVPTADLRLPDRRLLDVHLVRGIDIMRLRLSYAPGVARELGHLHASGARIVHDHGIWLHMNHAVARAARRLRMARIVSPRGMLQDWSMRYRGWRKRAAWLSYQASDLREASAFAATSREEAQALRAAGLRQPVAVIPNGVNVPAACATFDGATPRIALFLSRIHPKKGVVELVQAWASAAPRGWQLVIAGNDEGGHVEVVRRAIAAARCEDSIRIAGPVEGAVKERWLRDARLFVLPSHSENFGIAIGEALAHGLPVITTRGTPWQALIARRCGWWIDIGAQPLAAALSEATAMDDAALRDMGLRGRAFIAEEFSWDVVATRHAVFYRWVLEGGSPPPFVEA